MSLTDHRYLFTQPLPPDDDCQQKLKISTCLWVEGILHLGRSNQPYLLVYYANPPSLPS